MSGIIWNDKLYSLGIAEIDEQHKQFVELINELESAVSHGDHEGAVGQALAGVVAHIKSHFEEEEALMRKIKHPGYEEHKKQHTMFITKITNILKRMKRGQPVSAFELVSFLKHWMASHIADSDKKIAESVAKLVEATTK